MSDERNGGTDRLDSWKAIAAYLQRDETTARRWARLHGLPVRRVAGGRGHSVYAYASEIDAWLRTSPPTNGDGPSQGRSATPTSSFRYLLVGATVIVVVAIGAMVRGRALHGRLDDVRVDVTTTGVIAREADGHERWKYVFDPALTVSLPPDAVHVVTGAHPAVYGATHVSVRRSDGAGLGGMFFALDANGRPQRTFTFDDRVSYGGKEYGPPWAITAFAVQDGPRGRRIAVAAHHAVWDPAIVTILDENGTRQGTFVHSGWIESVRWLGPDRLVVAGFSNAHNGGMVAVLDPTSRDSFDGQGPEAPGTAYFCDRCGGGRPIAMAVFPRTDVNRATSSPFNRATLQVFDDHVNVRTIEVPPLADAAIDVDYEFTRDLAFVGAAFSDRYRELRQKLLAEGRLTAMSDDPAPIQMWSASTGWQTRSATPLAGHRR